MIPLTQTPPSTVCILRLSSIGDVTHVVPVIRTLQAHWPDTRITWIIGKLEAELVCDISGIDFIIFDKTAGWAAYTTLRKELGTRQFDLLLNMQASLRAGIASLFIKAPIKLGFDRARAKDYQWLFTSHKIAAKSSQHVLDGFFGFLEILGMTQRYLQWDIPIPLEANLFIEKQLPSKKRILAINPCSSTRLRNWRNWSAEGYAVVADYANKKYGMQVILTGGPSGLEIDFGKLIVENCDTKPINLIGKTSLKQLLALLNKASVLIAPDTGPAHMATTVGTSVIGLYATSNPLRTGPYLSQEGVINYYPEMLKKEYGLRIEDAPWGKRIRNPAAMQSISIADVKEKLDLFMNSNAAT